MRCGDQSIVEEYSIIDYRNSEGLRDTIWGKGAIIRSHSVIYAGCEIGDNFHAGHGVLVRELCKIGDNVSIGSHSVIEHHVLIKDGVRIHSNAFIPEYSILERNAWIGPGVIVTNAKYPASKYTKENLEGVVVGESVRVGAGAVLLAGIKLGEKCMIGAGAVVTKDVEARSVVVGNPAKVVKVISDLRYGRKKAYE